MAETELTPAPGAIATAGGSVGGAGDADGCGVAPLAAVSGGVPVGGAAPGAGGAGVDDVGGVCDCWPEVVTAGDAFSVGGGRAPEAVSVCVVFPVCEDGAPVSVVGCVVVEAGGVAGVVSVCPVGTPATPFASAPAVLVLTTAFPTEDEAVWLDRVDPGETGCVCDPALETATGALAGPLVEVVVGGGGSVRTAISVGPVTAPAVTVTVAAPSVLVTVPPPAPIVPVPTAGVAAGVAGDAEYVAGSEEGDGCVVAATESPEPVAAGGGDEGGGALSVVGDGAGEGGASAAGAAVTGVGGFAGADVCVGAVVDSSPGMPIWSVTTGALAAAEPAACEARGDASP